MTSQILGRTQVPEPDIGVDVLVSYVTKWTEEENKILIENFGKKDSIIAAMVNKTRSAVNGRINRLRLAGKLPATETKVKEIKLPAVRKRPVAPPKPIAPPRDLFDRLRALPEPLPLEVVEKQGSVNTYTMGKFHCKFPVPLSQHPNEHMLCCGERIWKGSWCKKHYYRVFNVKEAA